MDDFIRQLYQDRAYDATTQAVISVERRNKEDSSTDYFDGVLLVIIDGHKLWEVKHYEHEGSILAMHIVNKEQIQEWLLHSSNRRVIEWMINGKVLFDRNEYMKELRYKLTEFPQEERKKKIGIEFSKLVRRFADGKALFSQGHYLDSYNQIVHALHHLARLAVIEHGLYPEVTVWQQVKKIEPEIHKLYSELATGSEPVEKRLELLLLASEFELMTKTRLGSAHLIQLMREKETWTIDELKTIVGMSEYSLDLSMLVEYLVQKDIVQVSLHETKGRMIHHRYYQLSY
ncbi:hypothetical protein FLK61_28235 [Paenalkalicoccus suaedae]|uniref:Nucleotidyltransferase-like domain-containing protein n=1 Tax=Paenalkalicoccus suaedae TaxID=2592382 RepID=A0A859FEH9_9BACI|nr:nucleotidyltransferase-like protein [Paenalkalicoccus suaedae]QKS70636.1 hypothetical protein FLK61_28235 [Paenalkalicoccus suaedae]